MIDLQVVLDICRVVYASGLVLWIFFYLSVQLDRLLKGCWNDGFERAAKYVSERRSAAKGGLLVFDLLIYSPYTHPLISLLMWMILASLMFVI